MSNPLDQAGGALLPVAGLSTLAGLRTHPDVSVILITDRVWVTWPPGTEDVWQRLLAVPGVAFFTRRDGRWYRLGHHLPEFDLPPAGVPKPLDGLLFPAPVT